MTVPAPTTDAVAEESAEVLARMPTGEAMRRLVRPLVRLLVEGEPVTVGALATAAGLRHAEVEEALRGFPDAEWDDSGRLVGLGLSLRPTQHEVTVAGRTLYTWCAFDTLLMAVLLERPLRISSPDHGSADTVEVEADGQRVIGVQPPTAVISMARIDPEVATVEGIRTASCVNGHFFGAAEAAADWLADHPRGRILSVANAYEAARRMASDFFA
jgi:alkylmercury lyase